MTGEGTMHDDKWNLVKVQAENEKLKNEITELQSKLRAITQLHNEARDKLRTLVKRSSS